MYKEALVRGEVVQGQAARQALLVLERKSGREGQARLQRQRSPPITMSNEEDFEAIGNRDKGQKRNGRARLPGGTNSFADYQSADHMGAPPRKSEWETVCFQIVLMRLPTKLLGQNMVDLQVSII